MTSGAVTLEYPATTINQAALMATDKWRVLMEDPEAKLPWTAHFEFFEVPSTTDPSKMQSMCRVSMEFDQKIINELTGATAPSSSDTD